MKLPKFIADLPIVQAPMAGVQGSALTVAVSESGAVGSLPCAMLSADALLQEIAAITNAGVEVYNLNFFCHRQPAPDKAKEARWREALAPYYREYGVEVETAPAGPARLPFSRKTLELLIPYRPPIVSFHFGLPQREWIDRIKSWGGVVWSSATTVDEACWLEEHGADAVIAQGIEAGGHRGMFLTEDLSTQSPLSDLLPAIKHAVELPVIAAGGISSPDQVRTFLDAGAWAVQAGTAYLCCDEATTSDVHRNLLKNAGAMETQLTNLFSGRPARGLTNRLMRDLGPINASAPAFPLATAALAPLRAAAEAQGKGDFSPLWSGADPTGCRSHSARAQTQWLAEGLR